jgi:hypothetical protein
VFSALESLHAGPHPLIVAAKLLELLGAAGPVVLKGPKACGKQILVARPGYVEPIRMVPRNRNDQPGPRSVS